MPDESFGHRTVTDAAVLAFASLTGDYARLHLDHEFARSTESGPIAHGLLGASWALGALTRYAGERLGVGRSGLAPSEFSVRFSRVVAIGDTLGFRCAAGEGDEIVFEALNQRAELVTRGSVRSCDWNAGPPFEEVAIFAADAWSAPAEVALFRAQDLVECEFRGEGRARTLGEADIVAFTGHTAEANPLYLDAEGARASVFGERLVPPMLLFCLGFSEFLNSLLALPMPAGGFAGHLGDSWRMLRPVRAGDTLRARFRALSCRASKSRPDMGIVRFGLQLLDQREEAVLDGEVAMMIPARAD